MAEVNQYRVYCTDESLYVYSWATTEPTTCPNNNTHNIDASLTTITDTVSTSVVRAEENSDGYFETSNVVVNVPAGVAGTITEHDVTWPMDVTLWKTIFTPTADMIGDVVSVVAAPDTTLGVAIAAVNVGATTLNVNSTVTDNIWRGFLVTIEQGVTKNILGRCTAVDKINGTISVETPTVDSFTPGALIKIGIYVLSNIHIKDTNTLKIGSKGFKGKMIQAGMILRIYYTNNDGAAKVLYWRPEIYNKG